YCWDGGGLVVRRSSLILFSVFLLGTTSCGLRPSSTIDEDEAKGQIRAYAEEAVGALPGESALREREGGTGAACAEDQVQWENYSLSFEVEGVSEDELD